MKILIIVSLLFHATFAQIPNPVEGPQHAGGPPPKKWLTLNGNQPLVIARGGFSGLFPESSLTANNLALSTSVPDVTLFCNLQLTQDGAGICLTDLRLENATTISMVFPKGQKTYKVNGQDISGWFALDYKIDTLFNNVSLIQNIYSRPSVFDGQMGIAAVEDVTQVPAPFWLSVQYDSFYTENKLSVTLYLQNLMKRRVKIDYISSPEIGFLKSIGKQVNKGTKLIFEFKDSDVIEPTTNQTYGAILKDLTNIKPYVSGILVPKGHVWPVDSNKYLKPATTLVTDAHKAGLEVYAAGFANDRPASYNYSYDPSLEYLQFVDNSQFAVDGIITDFPPTASEAIACFAQQNASNPKVVQALIITHNGASGVYPGCTDLAYQQAVDDGADIIDCSVQMSKDGIAFCSSSADLAPTTTAMASFQTKVSNIPEIQNTSGIFSFDLTWSEIQSLKPQIESPFGTSAGFPRNPTNKNAGKFMSLSEFLKFAKTKAVTGIFINIENAAYLASKKGHDIIEYVKKALSDETLDKQSTQKVLIHSDDSSVLSKFQDVSTYKRVLNIKKNIGDAPKEHVDEIKKYADAVTILRSSLITTSNGFAMNKTKVFEEIHAANISVYVSIMRNEFISIAFDYFSDPTVELATFIAGVGVDGVITDYPATASRYMKSPCSDLNQNLSYPILPAEPGALMDVVLPVARPPASAPLPALDSGDVVGPPLPPVATNVQETPGGGAPAEAPKSSGVANVANLGGSMVAIMVLGLLFGGYY